MLDDHAVHTAVDSAESALNLGQHTFVDGAVGTQSGKVLAGDGRDDTEVVVHIGEHTVLLEAEYEVRRLYLRGSYGHGRGYAIGIAVEQRALLVVGDGAEDGYDALLHERGEERYVHALGHDIAHVAIVDGLGGAAHGRDDVGVGSREAYGLAAEGTEACHNLFVDEAGIYHGDHIECGAVGDATPIDHLCLYA